MTVNESLTCAIIKSVGNFSPSLPHRPICFRTVLRDPSVVLVLCGGKEEISKRNL